MKPLQTTKSEEFIYNSLFNVYIDDIHCKEVISYTITESNATISLYLTNTDFCRKFIEKVQSIDSEFKIKIELLSFNKEVVFSFNSEQCYIDGMSIHGSSEPQYEKVIGTFIFDIG